MFMYLKALGVHVFLTTTKNSYFVNGKRLEANAKSLNVLKSTLNDDFLSISSIESTFVVWNTLISIGEQTPHDKESDLDDGSDAFNMCYMVQGMTILR